MLNEKRIRIVVGHYGSGKSEFSVNYAMKLAQMGKKVALADIDVINMYFRSRESKEAMEKRGIRVIGSQIETPAIEVPTVSAEVYAPLQDKSYELIMDVGGNPQGARTLGLYTEYMDQGYDMLFIINANRPETQTLDQNLQFIKMIEGSSRLKVTGLVNNTHLLKATGVDDVIRGNRLAKEVSEKTGLPLLYNAALAHLIPQLPEDLEGTLFPIDLYLRDEWML